MSLHTIVHHMQKSYKLRIRSMLQVISPNEGTFSYMVSSFVLSYILRCLTYGINLYIFFLAIVRVINFIFVYPSMHGNG